MISVIIPVYNIENYVDECIRSILNQTYTDLEIIIVDDGSTDASAAKCDYYASVDSRIQVIHQSNRGLVNARKVGLEQSTGKYVTYVDGDDWIDADAYEYMYSKIVEYDADIVVCNHYESIGESDRLILNKIDKGYHNKESLVDNIYPQMLGGEEFYEWKMYTAVWDKLFRRDILFSAQLVVDERITIGEDIACVIPAMYEANSIFVSDKSFYHYRQTTSSMVKKVSDVIVERERYSILNQYMKEKFIQYGCKQDILQQWINLLLFIMVPRSEQLFDGFDETDYIFPYVNIKKGTRLALYCAGTYGQRLYNYIKVSGIADVVVWVDQNYVELQRIGLPVVSPEELCNKEFEGIVIATMFARSRKAIFDYITSLSLDVPIGVIDEHYLKSKEVVSGFRIM